MQSCLQFSTKFLQSKNLTRLFYTSTLARQVICVGAECNHLSTNAMHEFYNKWVGAECKHLSNFAGKFQWIILDHSKLFPNIIIYILHNNYLSHNAIYFILKILIMQSHIFSIFLRNFLKYIQFIRSIQLLKKKNGEIHHVSTEMLHMSTWRRSQIVGLS
jgi:hypothetical protein